ncbi:unnamed protein product [Brachionus calyciflorus]|uniref:Uncharacterized protein n=1 Tax=Brachionus calyciflorus TaxID=104777 RepID=A0A814CMD4_9BILA|nr:unnamed protein product [Brachionus calyciflorus]
MNEKVNKALKYLKVSLLSLIPIVNFFYLTNKFYFSGGKCHSKARLDGKTVIITGSNTGIGKEAALDLASRGARVIITGRDIQKAYRAAEQIRNETGNQNIVVEHLDLASFDSIRKFCSKINSREERIDILINSAGITLCPQWKTKEGFEMQFGVNYLGPFLLTNLLLDKIKKSAPSRIINVASIGYILGKINWEDLNMEDSYSPLGAYCQSKLGVVLFTRELARRLKGTNVSVFCLHPGACPTEVGRYMAHTYGWKTYLFIGLGYPIGLWVCKNAKEGAQTIIHCAVEQDIIDLSGSYFKDCKPAKLLPHGLNDEDAKRLWDLSESLTHLK